MITFLWYSTFGLVVLCFIPIMTGKLENSDAFKNIMYGAMIVIVLGIVLVNFLEAVDIIKSLRMFFVLILGIILLNYTKVFGGKSWKWWLLYAVVSMAAIILSNY
ncbi:hypothetical protein QI30_08130 [Kurthia sp. 3B1D]|uniref:Uncharacterized protein n=1 Tax=Candidatus Kurthia intestinigallinarum TaxID=1562256 RepID=A0A433RUQ9_9BACL|nr:MULTISPECIES: hypothetical protein [unclassified Kurthia]RUS57026.1 hypothetical protein QI30_08130 [Kurthia sp. 3B1D]